jgi:ABC-type sugar transport system ATPase subunit
MDAAMNTATEPAWLSVRGVAKSYGGVRALRGVDLDLAANQVYGFIGPNGAGKSTLMKVLAASVVPDSGEISIDGVPVSMHRPSVAMGHGLVLMPQEMTLIPDFSVTENITLGSEPTRFGMRSRRGCVARTQTALAMVGLDVDPSALASSLQPVQQRLLMLAKALGQDTRLLILDEPTAGLPPAMARQVTDTVLRLRNHGLTIVYVSHHLSEVAALSDHVVCIREGVVSTRLSGQQISKDTLIEAVVGTSGQDAGSSSPTSLDRGARTARPATTSTRDLTLSDITGTRLRGVNLSARSGEVTGITGLLGSGVAELVAIIGGSTKPLSGQIRLGGSTITPRSPADALASGIGTVTGDRARSALLSRTVRDNVSVTALRKWFGWAGIIRRAEERRKVAGALASLSVVGDSERPLGALSGGNQQRVLVSRLLAAELEVMVFDDPTVGVDVASRAQLWQELRALAQSRVVLVASGEAEELIGVCDRVICIHDGAVTDVLEGVEITEHAIARATS